MKAPVEKIPVAKQDETFAVFSRAFTEFSHEGLGRRKSSLAISPVDDEQHHENQQSTSGAIYEVMQERVLFYAFLVMISSTLIHIMCWNFLGDSYIVLAYVSLDVGFVGFVVFITADIDFNLYAQRFPSIILIATTLFLANTANRVLSQKFPTFAAAVLPLLYYLVRFRRINRMQENYPRFDQIVVSYWILYVLGYAASSFCLDSEDYLSGEEERGGNVLLGCALTLGAALQYCSGFTCKICGSAHQAKLQQRQRSWDSSWCLVTVL
jgi:hypothetical protein